MRTFEIGEDFLLDGKPIKLLSGAIHYFRLIPEDWEHSLYNLKALGFNTVETYIPWNLHEPTEGNYDFSGLKNLDKFIQLADKMGLLVIARPTPYICAEWDYGGLPAWLLTKSNIKVRTSDPVFLDYVNRYYEKLMGVLAPLQITQGGPVIMMQIENEYGSFGNDQSYLRAVKEMMRNHGIEVPLFTSDGGWLQALEAGSLCEDDVLPTANFGSDTKSNFNALETFMAQKNKKWPLMCMEFWDGWFNNWGDAIIRRDAQDVADNIRDVLTRGSINLYMFHGGTNFGFYNGCSDEQGVDKPQVTSYDYDAPLTEWGDPTDKYFAIAKVVKELFPDTEQLAPKYKQRKAYGEISLTAKTSMYANIKNLATPITSVWPLSMEEAGSGYGYILYRTVVKGFNETNKLKLVETSDRAHIFKNETLVATQYHETLGEVLELPLAQTNHIDILVENLGRINYGPRLYGASQKKGMRSGMVIDIHYHSNWEHYAFDLSDMSVVDYTLPWDAGTPAFYKYEFEADVFHDTFLDVSALGKGVVFINGFNLGRYWNKGPHGFLFIPGGLLRAHNTLEIFETEGVTSDTLVLRDKPSYHKH